MRSHHLWRDYVNMCIFAGMCVCTLRVYDCVLVCIIVWSCVCRIVVCVCLCVYHCASSCVCLCVAVFCVCAFVLLQLLAVCEGHFLCGER